MIVIMYVAPVEGGGEPAIQEVPDSVFIQSKVSFLLALVGYHLIEHRVYRG